MGGNNPHVAHVEVVELAAGEVAGRVVQQVAHRQLSRLEGLLVDVRLEGRAGLPEPGDDIELAMDGVVEEIGRADHGQDLAGLRVHRQQVAVVGAQGAEFLQADLDRVFRRLLHVEVQTRLHDEPAAVYHARPVQVFELLEDEVDEVRRLAAAVLLEDEVQFRICCLGRLVRCDHVLAHHRIEHDRLARLRPLQVQRRIVVAGPVGQAGQHGRLGQAEVARVLAEIDLRRRFDAGGVMSIEDGVQVNLQDLVLRISRLEGRGHHRLTELYED